MDNKECRMDYFTYKGTIYGVGTKVILKDSVHYKFYNTNKSKDDLFEFTGNFTNGYNVFQKEWYNNKGKRVVSQIKIDNFDQDIERIVYPVYGQPAPWYEKSFDNMVNKKVQPDIFGGCLTYVIVMIVGAIFINRWLIWIFSTMIFIGWLLNQFRT